MICSKFSSIVYCDMEKIVVGYRKVCIRDDVSFQLRRHIDCRGCKGRNIKLII